MSLNVWGCYRPVMFLHLSVILFGRGCVSQHASQVTWADTPTSADTPSRMVNERAVCILLECILVTIRNEVAKIMFYRYVSVHGGGGSIWAGTPPETRYLPPPPPGDGWRCGRYASYWNAFLYFSASTRRTTWRSCREYYAVSYWTERGSTWRSGCTSGYPRHACTSSTIFPTPATPTPRPTSRVYWGRPWSKQRWGFNDTSGVYWEHPWSNQRWGFNYTSGVFWCVHDQNRGEGSNIHLASTEGIHDQIRGEGSNIHLASTEGIHDQIRGEGSNIHLASTESVHDEIRGEGSTIHLASTEGVHDQNRGEGSIIHLASTEASMIKTEVRVQLYIWRLLRGSMIKTEVRVQIYIWRLLRRPWSKQRWGFKYTSGVYWGVHDQNRGEGSNIHLASTEASMIKTEVRVQLYIWRLLRASMIKSEVRVQIYIWRLLRRPWSKQRWGFNYTSGVYWGHPWSNQRWGFKYTSGVYWGRPWSKQRWGFNYTSGIYWEGPWSKQRWGFKYTSGIYWGVHDQNRGEGSNIHLASTEASMIKTEVRVQIYIWRLLRRPWSKQRWGFNYTSCVYWGLHDQNRGEGSNIHLASTEASMIKTEVRVQLYIWRLLRCPWSKQRWGFNYTSGVYWGVHDQNRGEGSIIHLASTEASMIKTEVRVQIYISHLLRHPWSKQRWGFKYTSGVYWEGPWSKQRWGFKYTSGIYWGPVYTKRQHQRCDDACDFVLIENSGVASKWVANLFWSDFIVFNENRIASIIAALTLTLGVNGPWERPWSNQRWVFKRIYLLDSMIHLVNWWQQLQGNIKMKTKRLWKSNWSWNRRILGSVCTKHQRQHCDYSAMMLAILFSLEIMGSLQNRVAIHFQSTPLFSMRTVSLGSSQSCYSIDSDGPFISNLSWLMWSWCNYRLQQ